MTWLDSLVRDARIGLRLLRRDAVVSAAAIVSLALAMGACTAAFALVDALILRQLPVRDPERLVYLSRAAHNDDTRFTALFSHPFFQRLRESLPPHLEVFSMSHQSLRQAVLPDGGGVEEKLQTQFVSGNAFAVLGVTAALGRVLETSDDARPGDHPVAVVSHRFWTRRLGADPGAVGRWIEIEQRAYRIVGVAQATFTGAQPGIPTDIWIPNMMFQAAALSSPTQNWLQVWGRLSPAESARSVRPIVLTTLENFEAGDGNNAPGQRSAELAIDVRPAATGFSQIRYTFARPLLILAAIVGLVLLIACSNVANLLLARGAARRREFALRASIGAGRGQLLQQILIESGILTTAAAGVGVLCAFAAIPLLVGMLTTNENPVVLDAHPDWRVLAFVAALGSVTTVLFGLAPALRASRVMPGEAGALGDRSGTGGAGMARSLVAAQIGFSLMIVFVAALLLRSFDRLLAVDLGFIPERLTLLTIETRDRLDAAQSRAIARQLIERARSLPGVDGASLSGWALFRGFSSGNNVNVPGGGRAQTFRLAVSPYFFRTMGTPLLEGREFEARDSNATNPMPVIVNATFANRHLPGGHAVGQRLSTTRNGEILWYDIVGVAADARDGSVRGEMTPFLFVPIGDPAGTLQIRSSLDARTLADRMRHELPQVHPSLTLVDVTRQSSLVGNTLLRERLLAVLSGFFATLGLTLAGVGLYGVLSYAVVRRRREIGIRLALGARPAMVVRSVVAGAARAGAVGIAVGVAGGLYFARFVRSLLFEIEPVSAASFGVPVLLLILTALVAAWYPARRATRVNPSEALRTD